MTESAKHAPPKYEARIKGEDGEWKGIGAAFSTSKGEVLSVKLDQPSDSFILVPKKDKPKTPQPK